ncbi:MAG: hypothetical protein EU541_08565 [Promethearchaeota archaeon]|nr:MAG: hypothetical protein EU541_08565 [Candidatus Lokiarchaeota archaeon]
MKNNIEKTLEEYLEKVKEKLPEWLKEDKDEVKEILAELEDHLRNRAKDFSDINQITEKSMRLAIAHMGSPSSIAREYKQRGTPHVYISKEMWPLYKKILLIVFPILIGITIFSIVFNLLTGNFDDAFNFIGYYTSFSSAFLIISIIFVVLSMEGYFPEDFTSKAEKERRRKEIQDAKEMGLPISPKTGKQMKPFVKPLEKFIGGAFGMLFAIILLIQPVPAIFSLMKFEFQLILLIFGILFLVDAITSFIRGALGNRNISAHQLMQWITIILKLMAFPIFIVLAFNPQIVPIINWSDTELIIMEIPAEFIDSYKISMILIGIVILVSNIANIYEIYKLQKYKID